MTSDATPTLGNHHRLDGCRSHPGDEQRPSRSGTMSLLGTLMLVLIVGYGSPAHAASTDDGFIEEEVRFESGDVTLSGTILVPDEASPRRHPAVALVHGSGPGPRESNRREAEAFAREGIVTLIYDKRTEGYSQFERSYELLAEDALAAVTDPCGGC